MSYTPTTWSTGDVISAAKINNLETQYADAKADAKADVFSGGGTFASQVVFDGAGGTAPRTMQGTSTGALYENWHPYGTSAQAQLYVDGSGNFHIATTPDGATWHDWQWGTGGLYSAGAATFSDVLTANATALLGNSGQGFVKFVAAGGVNYIESTNAGVTGPATLVLAGYNGVANVVQTVKTVLDDSSGNMVLGGALTIPSNASAAEITFSGNNAANIIAGGDFYLLAGSGGTGSIFFGGNGGNGQAQINGANGSFNVPYIGPISGTSFHVAGASALGPGVVEIYDALSVASGYAWGSFPNPGVGGLYVTGNSYLPGAHAEDYLVNGAVLLGGQSTVTITGASMVEKATYTSSAAQITRYINVGLQIVVQFASGNVTAHSSIGASNGPNHNDNGGGTLTVTDIYDYGVSGASGVLTIGLWGQQTGTDSGDTAQIQGVWQAKRMPLVGGAA